MARRLVVITGGPGSGKTSLVSELARRGHVTLPEAAIRLIEALNQERGIDGQKAWRRAHAAEFQERVTRAQVEQEAALPDRGLIFLDRGRLDAIGYCRHFQQPIRPAMEALLVGHAYEQVFVLDTLTRFPERGGSGRTSDRAASLALRARIVEVYREAGYEPHRVAEASVRARADQVLRALGSGPAQRT